MSLYASERHTVVTGGHWSADVAAAAVQSFVTDALRDHHKDSHWPIHPMDRSPERSTTLKTIYYGAAGMIWTLNELEAPVDDAVSALPHLAELARQEADALYPHGAASFLMGSAGFDLLSLKLGKAVASMQDSLAAALSAPPTGVVWGAAGGLLAAHFAAEQTADPDFRQLATEGTTRLLDAREPSGLWTTDLNGHRDHMVSALHGYTGNIGALLRVAPNPEVRDAAETILTTYAVTGSEGVNWPLAAGATTRGANLPLLLQYCNGAPGMLVCLARHTSDGFLRECLLPAGELIWRAGPPVKLPSLCHGAAGSGYALLALFDATGDEVWLERARAFAMHAIAANERFIQQHGQRKYSLWTGDAGLALFLRSCIDANAAFPTLDYF